MIFDPRIDWKLIIKQKKKATSNEVAFSNYMS